jgi:hypothetical protein
MTDPGTQTTAKTAAADVIDEASAAAVGTRKAALWIASAFGSIPGLAILSSVVRAPGTAGYDPIKLAVGVGLATIGAVIAVLGFARVIAPVPLEDKDLHDLDLRRIPGQPYARFEDLDRDMNDLRSAAVEEEYRTAQSLRASLRAKTEAEHSEAAAIDAERAAAAEPDDAQLKQRAVDARQLAERTRHAASAKEAAAAADATGSTSWDEQLMRRDEIRARAYRLKAADEVGRRYRHAQVAAAIAAGLIAAGIVLLALAPKQNAAPRSSAATIMVHEFMVVR